MAGVHVIAPKSPVGLLMHQFRGIAEMNGAIEEIDCVIYLCAFFAVYLLYNNLLYFCLNYCVFIMKLLNNNKYFLFAF